MTSDILLAFILALSTAALLSATGFLLFKKKFASASVKIPTPDHAIELGLIAPQHFEALSPPAPPRFPPKAHQNAREQERDLEAEFSYDFGTVFGWPDPPQCRKNQTPLRSGVPRIVFQLFAAIVEFHLNLTGLE
ncbi:hypothetical protein BDZ97DRAFT_1762255 [Flammula alnicola]|nr:hypothetical protein BDZ97DRAFT_1762255 [Flammula alnicola]